MSNYYRKDAMTYRKMFLLICSLNLLTAAIHAAPINRDSTLYPLNYIITLSAGPMWQSNGDTQTFALTPEIEKTYAANKTNQVIFDGELFLGLQHKLSDSFSGQLGFAVGASNAAKLTG